MDDFHGLYKEYALQVHRFASFLCGRSSLAHDITSETFVRAWTARGRIREATVKAYLFTIARNLYRDTRHRNTRSVQLEELLVDASVDLQAALSRRLKSMRCLLPSGNFTSRTAPLCFFACRETCLTT